MRKLSDEEKAELQAKMERMSTEGIHRTHGNPLAGVVGIVSEVAAGVAGGFAGLIPFLGISYGAFQMNDGAAWAGSLALAILLFVVGPVTHPLGTAVGVYLAGKRGSKKGSFLATLGGSLVGGLIGIGIWWKWLHAWGQSNFLIIPGLLTAPVLATVMSNLARKYRSLG